MSDIDIIFSIDHTSQAVGGKDEAFVSDDMHYTDIEDAIEISTRAFNKMTTSIPTPFARLYLYESAFKTLIDKEKKDVNGMNPFKGKAFIGKTINHYVIADALDMLEFLFEYGNDPCLKIEKWTVDDLELLHTELEPKIQSNEVTVEEKHNLLYESIKSNTIDGRLGGEFYIFKWCYQKDGYDLEEVIGATSPLTLVYTAPNWRTNKPQQFYGGNGNELFVEELSTNLAPVALIERSKVFRQYIYALFTNFNTSTPFFEYIDLTCNNYETIVGLKLGGFANFDTDPTYSSLRDVDGNAIHVTGVPLKLRDKGVLDEECEFVIVPTVKVLDEYDANAVPIKISERLPLVLSPKGIEGNEHPHYWYESQFQRNNAELKIPSNTSYFERTLPNVAGSVKYPNLRAEDFFEDKIVKLSYNLDNYHFITGMNGNCQYLLPIKSTYFKFFKAEDLKKQLSIVAQANGTVKATLTIPVRGKKTANGFAGANVAFEKVYANNEQTQIKQICSVNQFNLAIFPFYRLEGADSQYNCYEVMLGHHGDVKLNFFNDDINNLPPAKRELCGRSSVKVDSVRTRTTDSDPTFGITTTYYHIGDSNVLDGTFQFIEVNFPDGVNAVIAPDWSTARTTLGNSQYVVSVDFGTTNTHIAYALIKDNKVLTGTIQDMEYERGSQVVTLNEYGSDGIFGQFKSYLRREFVPIEIHDNAKVKFPIGTLIYEKCDLTLVKDLFGEMNIAFDLDADESKGLCYGELKSNIKWDNEPNAKNRIEAFFTEIMWMVKNKMVEIGSNMDFKFIFTFPQSMNGDIQQDLAIYWNDARKTVRAGGSNNNWNRGVRSQKTNRSLMPYEGLAPWYRSIPVFGTQKSFLNIDIGGGTFDVIVVKPTTTLICPGLSFSAQFAANVLWGVGECKEAISENGFYNYYRTTDYCKEFTNQDKAFNNYYNPKATEDKEKEDNVVLPTPEEIIPYLFKHDRKESEFSSVIRGNGKLRSLVLLHFSSIIYYIGRVLLLTETDCPTNVQFTGMGSLYINLITDNDDTLTELVKSILRYATSSSIDIPEDFQVYFKQTKEHPKKITAQGALIMWNTTMPGCTTPMIDSREVTIYGFEGDEDELVGLMDNQVGGQKDVVMERIKHFLGLFDDTNFKKTITEIGITDVAHLKYDNIKGVLDESFKQMSQNNNATAKDIVSKEAIFFWPLKEGIHKLAIEYAAKQKKYEKNV